MKIGKIVLISLLAAFYAQLAFSQDSVAPRNKVISAKQLVDKTDGFELVYTADDMIYRTGGKDGIYWFLQMTPGGKILQSSAISVFKEDGINGNEYIFNSNSFPELVNGRQGFAYSMFTQQLYYYQDNFTSAELKSPDILNGVDCLRYEKNNGDVVLYVSTEYGVTLQCSPKKNIDENEVKKYTFISINTGKDVKLPDVQIDDVPWHFE